MMAPKPVSRAAGCIALTQAAQRIYTLPPVPTSPSRDDVIQHRDALLAAAVAFDLVVHRVMADIEGCTSRPQFEASDHTHDVLDALLDGAAAKLEETADQVRDEARQRVLEDRYPNSVMSAGWPL